MSPFYDPEDFIDGLMKRVKWQDVEIRQLKDVIKRLEEEIKRLQVELAQEALKKAGSK